MQGIIDEIADTVFAYRLSGQEKDKQIQQLTAGYNGQAAKIKELEGIIEAGKAENERLVQRIDEHKLLITALNNEIENKALAAEVASPGGSIVRPVPKKSADQPAQ